MSGLGIKNLLKVNVNEKHIPVLLNEAVSSLQIKKNGRYVDLTLGACGHTREILNALGENGQLLGMDRDSIAINIASKIGDKRLIIKHHPFSELTKCLEEIGWEIGSIDGVLVDLGVSSMQIDDASRGFSFMKAGPLDMRMDVRTGITAEEWINNVDEQTIVGVLKNEGEERNARKIAKAIIQNRNSQRINTTNGLSQIIEKSTSRSQNGRHPATRSFQAIRIHINAEYAELSSVLPQISNSLKIGGRVVVIAFHSLEDRVVKNFINADERYLQNLRASFPKGFPLEQINLANSYQPNNIRAVGKPIYPNESELKINPRSRSAIMRVAEKI